MAEAAQEKEVIIDLEPEAVQPFRLFTAPDTQWNRLAVTVPGHAALLRTGLNYQAAETVARALGIDFDADLLQHLQVMEHEALKVFAEARP